MNFEKALEQFYQHYQQYDILEPAISRKYHHSLRVADIAGQIAKNEEVSCRDIEIAKVIGLLHDYARFEQWKQYKTYDDRKSVDHGDLAYNMLFLEKQINNFDISKEYYDVIGFAVKNHNKLMIEYTSDNRKLWFAKVVRDADKLDIFYLAGNNISLMEEDELPITDKVKESFYKEEPVSYKDKKGKNDHIILMLSMVFDLEFDYSYELLIKNNYIDQIYKNIKDKEKFKEYFVYINNYVKEKCKHVR